MTPRSRRRISSITASHPAWRQDPATRRPGQPELAHEPIGERRRMQPRKTHRPVGAAHDDARAGGQVVRAAAVAPQDAVRRSCASSTSIATACSGPTTSGFANSACADERHHDDRLDGRPDDRAAGREVVGGRPGRRRHDDAVAAERRQRAPVDLDDDLEHALAAGLLDRRLVERPRLVDDRVGGVLHPHLQRERSSTA